MPPARRQTQPQAGSHRPKPYASTHTEAKRGSSSRPNSSSKQTSSDVLDTTEGVSVKREETEREREKRKKRKRERARLAALAAVEDVKPSSSEMDLDRPHQPAPAALAVKQEHKPRPLTTATAGDNVNIPAQATAPMVQQKLEQKVEKQRARLKEAEARLLKAEEKGKKDAERIKALEARVKDQEGEMKTKEQEAVGEKQRADQHEKTIQDNAAEKEQVLEAVQEAVSCLICSDTLRDPHILSCGHMACRDCLKAWFRQPNAYLHDVGGTITPTRDMSYRSKVCHVCRTTVVRRPTRTYNLYTFLEPLGIAPIAPPADASQVPPVAIANHRAQGQDSTADPWAKTFPVEAASYRLRDQEDGTDRCPSCLHEIYDNVCDNCNAEFSQHGSDVDDFNSETYDNDLNDQTDDEEFPHAAGAGAGARPVGGGRRRAQVDIPTVEEVLGTTDEDRADVLTPPRVRRRQVDGLERGFRPRHHFDSDDEDDDDLFDHNHAHFDPHSDSEEEDGEYDGSVPRRRPIIMAGSSEPEYDSDYGGSFIDDEEEEEGYDLESTGSIGEVGEDDPHDSAVDVDDDDDDEAEGDETDQDQEEASEDLTMQDENEDGDEDEEEGGRPNMVELRRRRLDALINSRRSRSGTIARRQNDTSSDIDGASASA